ncbi:MAG: hypothetical protein H6Q90_2489 [Deltaproteobacteria bacterium]|nr:hypothetical protein [Deltaproteobacteria bacterium]
MTKADLDRIESELRIVLPRSYRELMSSFPVPAHAGNCDTDLWDDATALIEYNQDLRRRKRGPWTADFFFIGDPVSSSGNALDLRDSEAAVWWVDHCDLSANSSGAIAPSFEVWASKYVADVREDLKRDGIDPDLVGAD